MPRQVLATACSGWFAGQLQARWFASPPRGSTLFGPEAPVRAGTRCRLARTRNGPGQAQECGGCSTVDRSACHVKDRFQNGIAVVVANWSGHTIPESDKSPSVATAGLCHICEVAMIERAVLMLGSSGGRPPRIRSVHDLALLRTSQGSTRSVGHCVDDRPGRRASVRASAHRAEPGGRHPGQRNQPYPWRHLVGVSLVGGDHRPVGEGPFPCERRPVGGGFRRGRRVHDRSSPRRTGC